jgi:hypothetical protein
MWAKIKKVLGVLWDWALIIFVAGYVTKTCVHIITSLGTTPPGSPWAWGHVWALLAWTAACLLAGFDFARNVQPRNSEEEQD